MLHFVPTLEGTPAAEYLMDLGEKRGEKRGLMGQMKEVNDHLASLEEMVTAGHLSRSIFVQKVRPLRERLASYEQRYRQISGEEIPKK